MTTLLGLRGSETQTALALTQAATRIRAMELRDFRLARSLTVIQPDQSANSHTGLGTPDENSLRREKAACTLAG
jgi:hypothetical protein